MNTTRAAHFAHSSAPARKSASRRFPLFNEPTGARLGLALFAGLLSVFTSAFGQNAQDFTMYHYNRQRNGWKSNETILTPGAVSSGDFGEAWNCQPFATYTTGGTTYPAHLFASPLYLDSVTMSAGTYSGKTFSVVYAATSNNDIYAVSAVASGVVPAGTILWHSNLGAPKGGTIASSGLKGVVGTPVIDDSVNPPVMYVVADISAAVGGWGVFALNATSGAVLSGWPVYIVDSSVSPILQNGTAQFISSTSQSQHGALNLSADGSKLYVSFGGYDDTAVGFLVVVNTANATLLSAFASAPAGNPNGGPYGGMWSEAGVSLDSSGRIYTTTGNTPSGSGQTTGYWGESLLVFNSTLPLSLAGTYTPWNYPAMDTNDAELGPAGVNVLPTISGMNPNVVTFGGKQGNAYLVDANHLPGALTKRPATNLTSNQDQSLLNPTLESYYNNQIGPLNVFGPYSENSNDDNLAKARTTPAYYQTSSGNNYLVYTGSTKQAVNNQTVVPPCLARVLVNTSSTSHSYLSVDATETTLTFKSPGSPIVTSNGSSSFVSWNLDANVQRLDSLANSQQYLVAVDPTTMTKLFKSASGTLHPGGKYDEPTSGRGLVFVGSDRIQTFGLTASIVAIDAGGVGAGTDPLTGTVYEADADFSGGTTTSTTSSINTSRITHPAPTEVYQTARTAATGAGFTYAIPGLKANGAYTVRMHFCDPTSTAASQREFNVAINGTSVLTNYDVFAMSGGQNCAIAEPFGAVADSTGTITVAFTSGAASAPIVSAIEVRAPTLKFEAEDLAVNQFAGPDFRSFADAGQSAGAGSILDSTAVGNYITYIVPAISAGTYDVRIGYKAFNSRGICQLAIGPAGSSSPTNLGVPVDEYNANGAYIETDFGNWTPGTTSDKWFWFTVTGKNAGSSGYTIAFDYIKLIPK